MRGVLLAFILVYCLTATNGQQFGLPGSVPSPTTWVRADSNVVTSAGAVTAWNDIRGTANGYSVTGSGNDIQLTASSSQLNNQPVVHTRAGKTLLARQSISGTPYWVFSVTRVTGVTNRRVITADIGYVNWMIGHWNGKEDQFYFGDGVGFLSNPSTPATTLPRIYTTRVYSGGTQGFKNGVSLFSSASVGAAPLNVQLGGYPGETSDAEIAEVMTFTQDLTTAQEKSVHCYLGARYGITIAGCTTTPSPTTTAPTTAAPTTAAPTTAAPKTASPITAAPKTAAPLTSTPVSTVAPRAVSFPANVPSPELWVRADTGVVYRNSEVFYWNDMRDSHWGFDIVGVGGTMQVASSPQMNNMPVVTFPGGTRMESRLALNSATYWIFVVVRMTVGPFKTFVASGNSASPWILGHQGGNEDVFKTPSTLYNPSNSPATTAPRIYALRSHSGGSQGFKNGAQIFNVTTKSNPPGKLQLGGLSIYESKGEVAEFVAFDTDITSSQALQVHCYLGDRYGISIPACVSTAAPKTPSPTTRAPTVAPTTLAPTTAGPGTGLVCRYNTTFTSTDHFQDENGYRHFKTGSYGSYDAFRARDGPTAKTKCTVLPACGNGGFVYAKFIGAYNNQMSHVVKELSTGKVSTYTAAKQETTDRYAGTYPLAVSTLGGAFFQAPVQIILDASLYTGGDTLAGEATYRCFTARCTASTTPPNSQTLASGATVTIKSDIDGDGRRWEMVSVQSEVFEQGGCIRRMCCAWGGSCTSRTTNCLSLESEERCLNYDSHYRTVTSIQRRQTANDGASYANDETCEWTIQCPRDGNHRLVVFAYGKVAAKDTLGVQYDGKTIAIAGNYGIQDFGQNDQQSGGPLSFSNNPYTIRFTSDSSDVDVGFTLTAKCERRGASAHSLRTLSASTSMCTVENSFEFNPNPIAVDATGFESLSGVFLGADLNTTLLSSDNLAFCGWVVTCDQNASIEILNWTLNHPLMIFNSEGVSHTQLSGAQTNAIVIPMSTATFSSGWQGAAFDFVVRCTAPISNDVVSVHTEFSGPVDSASTVATSTNVDLFALRCPTDVNVVLSSVTTFNFTNDTAIILVDDLVEDIMGPDAAPLPITVLRNEVIVWFQRQSNESQFVLDWYCDEPSITATTSFEALEEDTLVCNSVLTSCTMIDMNCGCPDGMDLTFCSAYTASCSSVSATCYRLAEMCYDDLWQPPICAE